MDVQFRKHMVIPYDFETRVFESGEKALWQSEKNFTTSPIKYFLICYPNMHIKESRANSPILYDMLLSATPTEPDTLQVEH